MFDPGVATRIMACLLVFVLAGGVWVAPRAAHAQGARGLGCPQVESPEAIHALRQLERQVLDDLERHFAYLTFEHKLRLELSAEGRLKLKLELTTSELRERDDVQELARTVSAKLAQHLRARWPRLTVAPESQLVTRRPFSFTEQIPVHSAPLAVAAAPRRRITVAPPRRDARLSPIAGSLLVNDLTALEVALRNRVQRSFQLRWIVKGLEVRIPAPAQARARLRITLVSQGLACDRQRLRRAALELTELLKISGGYTVVGGSEIRFDLHASNSGANTGGLIAVFREGRWRIDGEEPPSESAPSPVGPARRLVAKPNAGGLPPVTQRTPVSASLPDRNRRPRKHLPLPPPPDREQSGAHRPISNEDLIMVPESVIGRVGSARARAHVWARRLDPGTYSNLGEVNTLSVGGAVSVVTARRVQATFSYAHPRQRTQLGTLAELDQSGDAVVFSLKYQTPPALRRHTHVALGADLIMQSRTSEAFRLPDDYAHADSVWATLNLWSSPISFLHLLVRRVGVFQQEREFTQVGVAQELLAHHPLRRAYWELVVDDRVDRDFPLVGRAIAEPLSFNVGAELDLGRRASLQINVPRLFSERYRQAQLVLSVGI